MSHSGNVWCSLLLTPAQLHLAQFGVELTSVNLLPLNARLPFTRIFFTKCDHVTRRAKMCPGQRYSSRAASRTMNGRPCQRQYAKAKYTRQGYWVVYVCLAPSEKHHAQRSSTEFVTNHSHDALAATSHACALAAADKHTWTR